MEAIQATADPSYPKARKPTMYFIGVTTGKSSIMKVFPRWTEHLRLGDVAIQGIDCKWHDDPQVYRAAVDFIKHDDLSRGALVTTHKIDLLKACRDLFDELDPYAELMGEVSSISKRDGRLVGHAKDPITSGLALEAFLPPGYWKQTGAEAFVMGAGGSSIAVTSYLMDRRHGDNRPSKILVSNRSAPRLDEIRAIHDQLGRPVATQYHHTPAPEDNDVLLARLPPCSLVINATGLGKDAPGSPITGAAVFPEHGWVWDFNYRGQLVFLDQARAQAPDRRLTIEDGWVYFIHGWTRVIADGDPLHYEVFEKDIPEEYGHLRFCISKLQPGRVGDECYMTKGHYHTVGAQRHGLRPAVLGSPVDQHGRRAADLVLRLSGRGRSQLRRHRHRRVSETCLPARGPGGRRTMTKILVTPRSLTAADIRPRASTG